MSTSLFVDLPNLYTQLVKSGLAEPKTIRDYFLNWFDFSILAKVLESQDHGTDTWIFYSHGRLGPSDARIEGEYFNQFVDRINKQRGVTAHDVNIPGIQRESLNVICPNCGQNASTTWNSEKGIDASLIVHLFDTMDSWKVAYLLSGDADFVPAVKSLRRKGKAVIGAGFTNTASPALIRECFEYIDLQKMFFAKDLCAYLLFRPEQYFEKWMTQVLPKKNTTGSSKLEIGFQWIPPDLIRFFYVGNIDSSILQNELRSLPKGGARISNQGNDVDGKSINIRLEEFTRNRIEIAIKDFDERIKGIRIARNEMGEPYLIHQLAYLWDEQKNQYVLSSTDSK